MFLKEPFLNPNNFFQFGFYLIVSHLQEQVKKHSVTKNYYDLSLFEQIALVISKILQILGLQLPISKVFLDHYYNFFSQQIRTILVAKYHDFYCYCLLTTVSGIKACTSISQKVNIEISAVFYLDIFPEMSGPGAFSTTDFVIIFPANFLC